MYIIQSGLVEITHYVEDEPFVIERLYRGSVLNHRSFLLNDENDTDGKCESTVSVFYIDYADMEQVRSRISQLNIEIKKIEGQLLGNPNPIALDYIIKVP